MRGEIPYWALDKNMVKIVRELNAYPGVTTLGSCEGHRNPSPIQHPLGHWFVTFRIAHTRGGWRSLELIASIPVMFHRRDENGKSKSLVTLDVATSSPRYTTGRGLFFGLNGAHVNPNHVAKALYELRTLPPPPPYSG